MTCIATQEQIRLLSKSENIKRYENLDKILIKFKEIEKPIYSEDIEYLKDKNKLIYNTLSYSFKELLEESSQEWYLVGATEFKQETCDLCGNKKLKYNFVIKNIMNENKMIIGSHCIDKFPDLNKNGINLKLEVNKAKKIDRNNKFNDKYEHAKEMIESWKNFYLEFPILLGSYLDSRFVKLIKDSQVFYDNFINCKLPLKDLDEFQKFILEFERLEKDAYEFYLANKDSKYICDKEIINWLKLKNKTYLRNKILKNNGLISNEIAKEMNCISFLNRFYDDIKHVFNNNRFDIETFDEEKGVIISFKVMNRYNLKLILNLKEFVEKFSSIYFEDKVIIDKSYIISNFRFYEEENNLEELVIILNEYIEDNKYSIKNEKIEGDTTKYIIVENKQNEVTKVRTVIMYNNIKRIFHKYKKNEECIIKYLDSLSSWKNKDKYSDKDIRESLRN